MPFDLGEKFRRFAYEEGANLCAFLNSKKIAASNFILDLQNLPASLSYLEKTLEKRRDIRKWHPTSKSVMICAWQYWNGKMKYPESLGGARNVNSFFARNSRKPPRDCLMDYLRKRNISFKIARYAFCHDYHKTIRRKLEKVLGRIQETCLNAKGKIFVDTSPVAEKVIGLLAGLGWLGKNGLLINKKLGSYFLIGGISLNLDISGFAEEYENLCADCNLCLEHCPTKALKGDGRVSFEKCLSYWTTQAKEKIPLEIKSKSGGWLYGCDICQEVCPYNKNLDATLDPELMPKF